METKDFLDKSHQLTFKSLIKEKIDGSGNIIFDDNNNNNSNNNNN